MPGALDDPELGMDVPAALPDGWALAVLALALVALARFGVASAWVVLAGLLTGAVRLALVGAG